MLRIYFDSVINLKLDMWKFALLTVVHVAVTSATNNSKYKVFRIIPENDEQLKVLESINASEDNEWYYWKDPTTVSKSVDLMVSPSRQANFSSLMDSHGIAYEIWMDNVEQKVAETIRKPRRHGRSKTFNWTRYQNLEEIYAWMDSLVKEFSSVAELQIGGYTGQGRKIRGVKLSYGNLPNKRGIFIEGGIHAREWISPATVTYLINQLLRSKDTKVRKLAESHVWYLFPVVNPDGYHYTHENPEDFSHRFWRKTHPLNDTYCQGADLNRNWGYEWNVAGASSDPCSHIYAGSSAFSTVEAKSLSEYITSISDQLFAYVAFHSYSQFLMFPYGYTEDPVDNYNETRSIALAAIKALSQRYGTEYKTGSIGNLLGLASGGSVDWIKATFQLPLVYVYELRDNDENGFLLPPEQIIPNGEEILDSFVALFEEAKIHGYPK